MSLIASIDYSNTYSNGTQVNGQVFIKLTDAATGQPANGNNVVVSYQVNNNGVVSSYAVTIPGQSTPVYTGRISDSDPARPYFTSFTITGISAVPDAAPPVTGCGLSVNFITIDRPETAPGANDAMITVNAASAYMPVQYSLNEESYQEAATFNGLSGGLRTVYVRDALGCSNQYSVDIPVLNNLLLADPSVPLPGGGTSRWNAAFNPVVFTYQRKDFGVTAVEEDPLTGNAMITVNANTTAVINNDTVYIAAGTYQGVYKVTGSGGINRLIIAAPYNGPATGFININRLRPYYQMLTRITYADRATGKQNTITSTNRPDGRGITRANTANFLQSLLTVKDDSDYTLPVYHDTRLAAAYQVAYAEQWDDGSTAKAPAFIPLTGSFYVLYSARQLGDRYGGNLAEYVPFLNVPAGMDKARWITDFAEPAYSNGYPFDIGFIYPDGLPGLNLFCELTLLDVNRNPLPGGPANTYLLNEGGNPLLNEDGSRLILVRQGVFNLPVSPQAGLNRLLINELFAREVRYLAVALKYDDGAAVHALTRAQVIRVDDAVEDQSVYLRWIGLTGCWNYYRFVYNQEVSLDVQNAVIIKNHISDWENQDSIEEVVSKAAGLKMKVMAEDLGVADIRGLQSIKYSPKVQLLTGKGPVKWQTIIINTATYSEYDTRNGQAPFSVTFNLPGINIQTQ